MSQKNGDPGAMLNEFVAIVRRLRGPGGCPWDAQQTPETLKTYVLEEAYELIEALDSGDPEKIKEELGDLLLHLVFLSDLYQERGNFSLVEVVAGIAAKMIHRHPHVFKGEEAKTQEDLRRLWQQAKAQEGKTRGPAPWARCPRPCRPWSRPSAWGRPRPAWVSIGPTSRGPWTRWRKSGRSSARPWPARPIRPGRRSWGTCSSPW